MKTIQVLQMLDKETKADVYLVGGAVRDLIRNKKPNGLDVVVRNMPLKHIVSFLKKYGKVKHIDPSRVDKFDSSLLIFTASDNTEAQIRQPRIGKQQKSHHKNTLKEDASHRDFTLNAMYLPVNYNSKDEIIDFFGGQRCIKNKRIEAVGNTESRIAESPIRMMRAFSLSARLGYSIDTKILTAIQKYHKLLYKVSKESIRKELDIILLSKKPSRYFNFMIKTGVLGVILPELAKCKDTKQDKRYHKYNVFHHCIYTCDHIESDIVLRLAAILHDIGKYDTRAVVKNKQGTRITFHKHEMHSLKLAKNILTRLNYDSDIKKRTCNLIAQHMYHYSSDIYKCTVKNCTWSVSVKEQVKKCPICNGNITTQTGWTDAAVRRFIKKNYITRKDIDNLDDFPLFKLRAAERLGNGYKTIAITNKQKDFQKRIVKVYKESSGLDLKDLKIDGDSIMKTFNINPGIHIGEILNFLMNKVFENPKFNNELELLKLTTEYLYKRKMDRLEK
jgi:tRNA nucleotidyltransferase/poly(A) polymerase